MSAHRDPQRGPPGGGRNSGAHGGDVREERHVRRDRARGRSRAFRGGGRVGTGTGKGGRQSLRSFLGPRGSRVVPGRRPAARDRERGQSLRSPAVVSSEQPPRQGGRLRGGVSGSLRGLAQSPGPGLLGTGLRGVCVSITQPHCADENPLEVSPRSLTGCLRPCESPQPNAMLMNHRRSKSTL